MVAPMWARGRVVRKADRDVQVCWVRVRGDVNDSKLLGIGAAGPREKVLSVTLVIPDFIGTVLVGNRLDDFAGTVVDDHRRWHGLVGVVAAQQYLVIRGQPPFPADRHICQAGC